MRPMTACTIALCHLYIPLPAIANCEVQVSAPSFGLMTDPQREGKDAEGQVNVFCAEPTSVRIRLGPGLSSQNVADRRMTTAEAGTTLGYNLFTDSTRSLIWGDGTAGTHEVVVISGNSVPIYARVPARQNPVPGSYSDLIEVIVEW